MSHVAAGEAADLAAQFEVQANLGVRKNPEAVDEGGRLAHLGHNPIQDETEILPVADGQHHGRDTSQGGD